MEQMNPVKDLRVSGPRPHHPNLGPSSIPALLQCACFAGRGESDDDANTGNLIHDHAQNLVAGIEAPTTLDRGQQEACEWAANEVKTLADIHAPGEEIRIEERLEVAGADGKIVSWGFADFNVGILLPDLKSGLDWRPDLHWHKPQLATYALARMQKLGVDKILCVEIYVLPNRKREYWITRSEAEAYIAAAIARRNDPERRPLCCDYCKWCRRIVWCPAVNAIAWRTVELFARANGNAELFACPEHIDCSETMAQALTIYKKVIVPLGKRIEDAALALSDKLHAEGKEIPYYTRELSRTREKIVDVRTAFNRMPEQIDSATFSQAISTTPKAVSEVYARTMGLPEKVARKAVNELLEDLIVCGESSVTLKPLMNNQTKRVRK
jgi:hypothetical protein